MTKITTIAQLADATGPELIEAFKAFGGKFKEGGAERFASLAAGRGRVEMLMMASQDASGHLGVPKGEEATPLTKNELTKKAKAKKLPVPIVEAEVDGDTGAEVAEAPTAADSVTASPSPVRDSKGVPAFAEGTLARQLQDKADNAAPIAVREKAKAKAKPEEGATRKPKQTMFAFRATGAGTTRLQSDSRRAGIAQYIAASPNQAQLLTEIEKKFEPPVKSEVMKLLKYGHIVLLSEAEFSALPVSATAE